MQRAQRSVQRVWRGASGRWPLLRVAQRCWDADADGVDVGVGKEMGWDWGRSGEARRDDEVG